MIPGTIDYASLGTTRWTMPARPERPARIFPSATHVRDNARASRNRLTMPESTMRAMLDWSEAAYPETPSGRATADN